MRAYLWAVLSVVLWTRPAMAQTPSSATGPRLVVSWSDSWDHAFLTASAPAETGRARALGRGTKWALGGAVVVGTLSAAFVNTLCERSTCSGPTLKWGFIGAGIGAVLGGIIAEATDKED